MQGNSRSQVLVIEQLTIKQDRVICDLAIDRAECRYTNPELVRTIVEAFPFLPDHICKNSKGATFAEVMEFTSLPHLLEHLVIDLQAGTSPHSAQIYVGTSEWLDEQVGRARIEVSFTDDLNALRAFRDAILILNKAMI